MSHGSVDATLRTHLFVVDDVDRGLSAHSLHRNFNNLQTRSLKHKLRPRIRVFCNSASPNSSIPSFSCLCDRRQRRSRSFLQTAPCAALNALQLPHLQLGVPKTANVPVCFQTRPTAPKPNVVCLQRWWAPKFAVALLKELVAPSDVVVLRTPRDTAKNALVVLQLRRCCCFSVVTYASWSPCTSLASSRSV